MRLITVRLDALGAWLLEPMRPTRLEVIRVQRGSLDLPPLDPLELREAKLDVPYVALACSQALAVANVLASHVIGGRAFVFGEWWPHALTVAPRRSIARIRAALRRSAIPWALGAGDPLVDTLGDPLDRIEIASPCSRTWESLERVAGDRRVRHCGDCDRNVYDFTSMTREAKLAILRAHEGERLCARVYQRPDGRVLSKDCAAGLRGPMIHRPTTPATNGHVLGGIDWTDYWIAAERSVRRRNRARLRRGEDGDRSLAR